MQNTILICATFSTEPHKVVYNANIYAHSKGEPLQFLASIKHSGDNSSLWRIAKLAAKDYFDSPTFLDGAYTAYLQDLTEIK